ncbi:DUF4440 domain-containing protein [Streptomyces sp. NPDC050703]|uniref:DUF4440 domain-containing protein n=1 Tax=Streptomyces sp. NPDC050703 TaxID=3157218 RepID=UPI00343339BB
MSQAEIDTLTAEFFGSFDNRDGGTADVARLRRLMLPGGVIAVTAPAYRVFTVEEFIGPREELLAEGGRVREFHEWEVSARTDIHGDIASRFGEYAKAGIMDGKPFEGGGMKTIQFVRTPEGWRISAFAWHDRP